MLAEAQEAGQIFDEEQLAFLADPGVSDGQAVQTIVLKNAAFQTKDFDAYDSDCDDLLNAQAVLTANISNYGYDVISEVPQSKTYLNDIENQNVLVMQDFKQPPAMDSIDNEIDSDSNIILVVKIRTTPNALTEAEQAFWLHMSDPTSKPSDALPVKIEAPKELPKISLANESLKKLKFNLAKFDSVVKIRTTPNALTEGEWGFEHTKDVFNNEIIPFLKSLKDIFNMFDRDLLNEIMEVQTVFVQIDVAVQIKGKEIVDIAAQKPSAITIVPRMFKLDLAPLSSMLLQNKEIHLEYLKNTQEQADILQGIELLVYVQDTCPNAINHSVKKVAVTPKNKVKKVRFTEPLTSSSNIKQVESSITSDSNTHVLSPTGLKCSNSNCGSTPTGNKKNDTISQTPSRNIKNKVEVQPRNVNKKNRVVEPICNVDVKQSQLNANSELICATCKKSMFDGVHDLCILNFLKNVNSRAKPAKKHKKTKYVETYGLCIN
uniref:Retrovirus-related Pol polyprotein from transposon TNT 1-94 n=1 Tax=Tanacetum cinerariifolium TaxID=118510 RepID=A0A6L2JF41_TANCI|nr:hypothetical protein [Tanacetum cinerariifolium]